MTGEDVEDEAAAIEDAPLGQRFEVAHLGGREIVVENDQIGTKRLGAFANFGGFTLAYVVGRVNALSRLEDSVSLLQGR